MPEGMLKVVCTCNKRKEEHTGKIEMLMDVPGKKRKEDQTRGEWTTLSMTMRSVGQGPRTCVCVREC